MSELRDGQIIPTPAADTSGLPEFVTRAQLAIIRPPAKVARAKRQRATAQQTADRILGASNEPMEITVIRADPSPPVEDAATQRARNDAAWLAELPGVMERLIQRHTWPVVLEAGWDASRRLLARKGGQR